MYTRKYASLTNYHCIGLHIYGLTNLKYQDRHITLSFQNSGPTVRTGQGKLIFPTHGKHHLVFPVQVGEGMPHFQIYSQIILCDRCQYLTPTYSQKPVGVDPTPSGKCEWLYGQLHANYLGVLKSEATVR